MGHVNGKERRGTLPEEHYPQRCKVTLHREGDRWLLDSYKMEGFGIGSPYDGTPRRARYLV